MIAAMLLGETMIAAATAGWPTSVALYVWACTTMGLGAVTAPLLLLAWQLPNDTQAEDKVPA